MKLIWRNIWRNRRRTVITMASVFFAVFFCVLFLSLITGVYDRMIDNTLETQTGHIQIHAKGYWDDKGIDNFMFMEPAMIAALDKTDNIENVSPRVEIFAMAASSSRSKGVAVIGVSPEREAQKSNLSARIEQGKYLSENDDGVIIGRGLAAYLKVTVGDTLALIGQGYHGASAAGLFPVRGIMKKQIAAEMDNALIYMTLPTAQQFIDMPNGYSGILISINDNKRLDETISLIVDSFIVNSLIVNSSIVDSLIVDSEATDYETIKLSNYETNDYETIKPSNYETDYEVVSWHFTMERLLETAKADKAMSNVILFILYVIVGFGILGTVIMMTNERKREFCMMISLGMSRMRLAVTTALELLLKSLIGVAMAFAVTLPIVHWFAANPIQLIGDDAEIYTDFGMEPILPMAAETYIFVNQMLIVIVISLLTMIYPVWNIFKLNLNKSK